jgi:glycerol-3-phosphate dehydrogenase
VVESPSLEPIALDDEIEFILHTFNKYSKKIANKSAILSKFSGLRPLAKPTNNEQKTKEISRSHKIMIAKSGLISILGGKWTTYRRMAEDTVNAAIKTGNLRSKKSLTATFQIHGYCISENNQNDHLTIYGSDAAKIRALINDNATLGEKLHTNYPYLKAEVVWAVRFEMALKVEDFLSRRIRILFLDAEAAIEMSTKVAEIMAKELDKDSIWINEQLNSFKTLANGYLIK